jgi:hypothetical protein
VAVHQIEQYYIYFNLSNCSDKKIKEVKEMLILNDIYDAEFTEGHLTIDDFDSDSGAEDINEMINDIIDG